MAYCFVVRISFSVRDRSYQKFTQSHSIYPLGVYEKTRIKRINLLALAEGSPIILMTFWNVTLGYYVIRENPTYLHKALL